jgi:hypothetical protein
MQFVGKILVVLQLILSIFFMAFAGVVYNTQMKWRDHAKKQEQLLATEQGKLKDKEAELALYQTKADGQVNEARKELLVAQAQITNLSNDKGRLQREVNEVSVGQKISAEQAEIAGDEAQARNEEALNQRKLNQELQIARDIDFARINKLDDEKRALQLDLDTAKAKNRDLLTRNSLYQQALAQAGITADPTELATRNNPAPRVEGIIVDVKAAKRQGASELVEISLGSDMGLKKGHEMTVCRLGVNNPGQRPKFLCKIVIVNTTPDKAVGEVIESTRNGVIQKGDNVTTKL